MAREINMKDGHYELSDIPQWMRDWDDETLNRIQRSLSNMDIHRELSVSGYDELALIELEINRRNNTSVTTSVGQRQRPEPRVDRDGEKMQCACGGTYYVRDIPRVLACPDCGRELAIQVKT